MLTGEQLSEVKEKKRAQTLPSPLWKDRSGRLPETALSLTSSRESFGVLPKRRTSSGLPVLRVQLLLDTVSTTCDSGWVNDRDARLLWILNLEVDPPAIAGGTDLSQV